VRRLGRALEDAPLIGPRNNGRFLLELIRHPDFSAARMSTTSLDEWAAAAAPLLQRPLPPEDAWRIAAAVLAGDLGARPASVAGFSLALQCQGEQRTLRAPVDAVTVRSHADARLRVAVDGVHRRLTAVREDGTLHLVIDGATFSFAESSPFPTRDAGLDPSRARAPVAGIVAQVLVRPGDVVVAGQPLLSVEAMKMEMWLHAGSAGTVREVHAQSRASVAAGQVLVELEMNDMEPDR
jgi:geranyl-CoA carboxylase alpha subunit